MVSLVGVLSKCSNLETSSLVTMGYTLANTAHAQCMPGKPLVVRNQGFVWSMVLVELEPLVSDLPGCPGNGYTLANTSHGSGKWMNVAPVVFRFPLQLHAACDVFVRVHSMIGSEIPCSEQNAQLTVDPILYGVTNDDVSWKHQCTTSLEDAGRVAVQVSNITPTPPPVVVSVNWDGCQGLVIPNLRYDWRCIYRSPK